MDPFSHSLKTIRHRRLGGYHAEAGRLQLLVAYDGQSGLDPSSPTTPTRPLTSCSRLHGFDSSARCAITQRPVSCSTAPARRATGVSGIELGAGRLHRQALLMRDSSPACAWSSPVRPEKSGRRGPHPRRSHHRPFPPGHVRGRKSPSRQSSAPRVSRPQPRPRPHPRTISKRLGRTPFLDEHTSSPYRCSVRSSSWTRQPRDPCHGPASATNSPVGDHENLQLPAQDRPCLRSVPHLVLSLGVYVAPRPDHGAAECARSPPRPSPLQLLPRGMPIAWRSSDKKRSTSLMPSCITSSPSRRY